MAKKKTLNPFEIALDAVRSPVRGIDEAIRNWDALAKAGDATKHLNGGTRVASIIAPLSKDEAKQIAQAVFNAYAPRFQQCMVYTVPSAYDGKPLATGFTFYEIAWSESRGVVLL